MLTSGNFLTMLARGSGSAASSDPQSRPASSPTSAREKSLFMTAFRLGRRAPASFDAAADQRFRSLVLLVESGQGPFDNRRQKAWLLPANRDWVPRKAFSRGGGAARAAPSCARGRRGYISASWKGRYDPTASAPPAGRRRDSADAWRTRGAACGARAPWPRPPSERSA